MKIRINDVQFHKSFWVDEENICSIDSQRESEKWVKFFEGSPQIFGKNKWYGHKIFFYRPVDEMWYGLLVSKRTYDRIFGDIWEPQKNNG